MRTRLSIALLFLAFLVAAAGCTTGDDTATTGTSDRDGPVSEASSDDNGIVWGTCTDQLARMANLECGVVEVPIDHDDPGGGSIDLALIRQRATGSEDERIGSLLLNPGGPGGSGIEFLSSTASVFPEELSRRFDLVSFDPRGVGESSPVRCISDETKSQNLEGDLTPRDDAQVAQALDEQRAILESCSTHAADLITHMSTADVASDLDAIRAALGDEKLTYMGFSYGTAIGAVYATMFPDRTRALVLDGSVDPDGSIRDDAVAQARGFETALENFTEECDAAPACALAPRSRTRIERVRRELSRRPVVVEESWGTREMGLDQFDLALATGLYDTTSWGLLARAVADIHDDGAEMLFLLLDRQTGRKGDGSFDNSADAQTLVNCADLTERPEAVEAVEIARSVAAEVPVFGDTVGWSAITCIGWPEPANPTPRITGEGAGPILVVGTKGDPATPYEWAEEMADTLPSASLLTYEGNGHTAFLTAGECVDDIVSRFLIDLREPSADATCPAGDVASSFEGLSTRVVEEMVNGGIPREVAQCIVDAAIDDVGESAFSRMILRNEAEELSQLIMAKTLSCVTVRGSGDG